MTTYTTETGYYVLVDDDGRIGGKANVSVGEHPVADWVDPKESFDVGSAEKLSNHDIHEEYRPGTETE